MSEIPIAKEYLIKRGIYQADADDMIEFVKLHIDNIRALQQSKYFAGETGYITNEEWINILENIK